MADLDWRSLVSILKVERSFILVWFGFQDLPMLLLVKGLATDGLTHFARVFYEESLIQVFVVYQEVGAVLGVAVCDLEVKRRFFYYVTLRMSAEEKCCFCVIWMIVVSVIVLFRPII